MSGRTDESIFWSITAILAIVMLVYIATRW